MQQLDTLAAATDTPHHYQIDTGLYLLLFHAKLTDEQKASISTMRTMIGGTPDDATSAQVATQALALLNDVRRTLSGPNYSAIFSTLNLGLQSVTPG